MEQVHNAQASECQKEEEKKIIMSMLFAFG
jgi:hypothetical protein